LLFDDSASGNSAPGNSSPECCEAELRIVRRGSEEMSDV
jgi:hypothetical protein